MLDTDQAKNAIPVYSVHTPILGFFASHTEATQQECNERAASLLGSPVTPIPIQGAFSYTVVGGSPTRLVQFRTPESDLEVNLLHLARSIHGGIVARTICTGAVGRSPPLSVYIIEKLPGITYMEYCLANDLDVMLSSEQARRQENIVIGFARYCRTYIRFTIRVLVNSIIGSLLHPGKLHNR